MSKVSLIEKDWQAQEVEFERYINSLCAPPSDEPTEVFAELHVIVQDGPFAGSHWRLQFTPFAKFIFAGIRRPGVKRVTIMMSAQYVKTLVLLITFLRNAAEDPGDTMWVLAEGDHMGEFIEKRLIPYIEGCDKVAPLLISKSGHLVRFETFNLLLRGSNSRAKLQSDPIRRVICDERREWKKGSIDLLRKRMRTFPNAQEISAGTAGKQDDELHADYNEGSQTRAHIRCLHCGHSQPIRFGREITSVWKTAREWGGFVWTTDETTKPGGVWNWPELKKTVRFECENPACLRWYSNDDKYELLRTMHTHDYNPLASPDNISFGGSAFEAIWESCDWDKLVQEFLKAVDEAKKGNVEPLKAFITETLGEPWMDQLGVIEDSGFLEARKAEYGYGEAWPEMKRAFMSADAQERGGEHYPWVIRAFGLMGKSRLIAHGVARTLEELEQIRHEYKIGPTSAIIDTGFMTQKLYRFCLAYSWKAFKGENRGYYLVAKPHPKNQTVKITVRQLWHKSQAVVYNASTKKRIGNIVLYLFCNDATNELLAEYQLGLAGDWTIPDEVARDYIHQMVGDVRREKIDERGQVEHFWKTVWDNHFRDCERMILTAAIITGNLNAPPPPPPREPKKPGAKLESPALIDGRASESR